MAMFHDEFELIRDMSRGYFSTYRGRHWRHDWRTKGRVMR